MPSGPVVVVVTGGDAPSLAEVAAHRAAATGVPAELAAVSSLEAALRDDRLGMDPTMARLVGAAIDRRRSVTDYFTQVQQENCTVHVFGLVSEGSSHGDIRHIHAVTDLLSFHELPFVVHAILDGIDMPEKSAWALLDALADRISRHGSIATLSGRSVAFDASEDWERTLEMYDAVVHADADRYDAVYEGLRLSYDAGYVDASLKPVVLGGYGGVRGELALQMPSPTPAWTWRSEDLAVLVGLRGEAFRQLVSVLTRTALPDEIAERLTIRGRPVVAFEPENVTSFVAVDASPDIAVVFPDPPQWTVDAPFAERGDRRLGVAAPGRREAVEGWFRGGSSADGALLEEVEDGPAAIARAAGAVTAGDAAFIVVGAGAADATAIATLADVVKQRGGLLLVAAGDGSAASRCLAAGGADVAMKDDGSVADVVPTILEWLGVTAPDGLAGRSLLRGRRTS